MREDAHARAGRCHVVSYRNSHTLNAQYAPGIMPHASINISGDWEPEVGNNLIIGCECAPGGD